MITTIAEGWESFEKNVISKDAPEIQRREMRRAFYAGAWATLQVTAGFAYASVSDEAGAAMIEGLHDESRRFAAEVAAGRA